MSTDNKRERIRKAQKKYVGKCRTFVIRFRMDADADIIDRIESMPNKIGYIRELVRKDIQREKTR